MMVPINALLAGRGGAGCGGQVRRRRQLGRTFPVLDQHAVAVHQQLRTLRSGPAQLHTTENVCAQVQLLTLVFMAPSMLKYAN